MSGMERLLCAFEMRKGVKDHLIKPLLETIDKDN
jgi:hypothetical protein